MKRLTAIFALATLAGCVPADNGPSSSSPSAGHLQTMMNAASGDYSFTPNTGNRLFLTVFNNADPWDLVVKLDQYRKTENDKEFLCAHFRTVVVNMTGDGKYLLPYHRMVRVEDTSSYQVIQVPLNDFATETLINLPERLPDEDHPDSPFQLADVTREICVPQYDPKVAP